jgi:hypothetical protein
MCDCKKRDRVILNPKQPVIETTSDFDNIDEFFIPQTPDQQLHKELMDWKNLDKFTDNEDEYPLIED